MRFDRLRLRNFKPYADTELQLTDGVTVIHGLNGSGKSSLLEAAFFALYGSAALEGTLADAVTNGETESAVELWFTHDGESYHVNRELRERGDRMGTVTCTLSRDGEVIRDGATDVEQFVRETLRMDADAFVNCAYVKQGQVNKLINASPSERQRIIDDLLQLGKLEQYRDRADDARLGIEDVLNNRRGALEDIDGRIEQKEAQDLPSRLNALESKLGEVSDEIADFESEREKAVKTKKQAQEVLDEQADRQAELEEVESQIGDLKAEIRQTESEREELQREITEDRSWVQEAKSDLQNRLAETEIDSADPDRIDGRLSELAEREAELREQVTDARETVTTARQRVKQLRSQADDQESAASKKRSEADELESTLTEDRSELADREEKLERIDERITAITEQFEATEFEPAEASAHLESVREEIQQVRDERSDLQASLEAVRESIEQAEELLDAGNCPECGQPVDGAPNVESLEADRERATELKRELADLDERADELLERRERAEHFVELADELGSKRETRGLIADDVQNRREGITDTQERIETLRSEADEAKREATDLREQADQRANEADEASERVDQLEAEIESCEAAQTRLEGIETKREAIADRETEIERKRDRREELAELNDERRERLSQLESDRAELAEAVDEARIEEAKDELSKATDYIERVDEKLDELRERRDELQGQIGAVRNELSDLEDLREQRETMAERVAALEQLHAETEELAATYGDLRAELRRRNVTKLERRLNETFDLVYGNDAYSHIELDGEYGLTVYQKDGEPLEPDQLSGGERALFNLSLRCGIYRLLTEGVEGTAPTPPLILDEPTVFLDDGHVSRLVDLVEEMRGFGVRQIIIVSHDDELVGAADDLVHVEKDPTTNRSTAHRMADPSVSALGGADD